MNNITRNLLWSLARFKAGCSFLHISFLLPFLVFTSTTMAQETNKLIYFADPMCSWCYGFSPQLTKVVDNMGDSIEFEMVMGGLRPYNTETMKDLGDFLKEHWQEVAQRSGQAFSYEILEETAMVYDTEPACRAVALMRSLEPEKAFDFFKAIQKAFYEKNKNPNETATYVELAGDFGVDRVTFQKAFESDEWKAKIKEDFQYAATLGVRGYPTLVYQKGKDLYLLSNGYTEAAPLLEKIADIK